MMNTVVLLLGSNLYNRTQYIKDAVEHIREKVGNITRHSQLYETEPWGFITEFNFLNQVIICQSALSAVDLLHTTKQIESAMGRIRNPEEGYTSRKIDIDILFYNDDIIEKNNLTIPHPRLHERKFTLVPLNELLPDFIHPVYRKKVSELLHVCKDELTVHVFDNN
ncbi:MAG: 2-amino-4-hydroxy-6-hydroxymethyldihydropteridine diphosphokinase [Bacteroidetes bacterium]|nr:2-amino-4-hydroxy-6-hydroxymethyldihydropteridine diphosphokinase [Bacteroidota bacterium]